MSMTVFNNLDVYERSDGRYDFRIVAQENGNILCGSDQGYEDRDQAERMGRRAMTAPIGVVSFTAHGNITTTSEH